MSSLPVVILAAGRGQRLAPLTDALPKCLLPVGPLTPLGHLLDSLRGLPVREIVLLTGHARERIREFLRDRPAPFPVVEIWNQDYGRANNIVSAAMAREHCPDGFVLVNSDVLAHPELFRSILAPPHRNVLVVDPATATRAEAMKVGLERGRLAVIGKSLPPEASRGEYVGIARFDATGAGAFFRAIDAILETREGRHEWYEAAIGVAAREVPIRTESTNGLPWTEIDDPADLSAAERDVLPRIKDVARARVP